MPVVTTIVGWLLVVVLIVGCCGLPLLLMLFLGRDRKPPDPP